MSSCCPSNSEPVRASAGGEGVVKSYNNTSLFVTGPAKSTAGVLAFPDIYGVDSGRTKKDAEAFGRLGYAVVLVDLADGEYLGQTPEDRARMPKWLEDHAFEKTTGVHVRTAIEYLTKEAGVTSISSYGYCWGAWVGAALSSSAEPVIKGHASFHPAWIVADMLNGEGGIEKLAEAVNVPQLLLSAGNDPERLREGGSVDKILKGKTGTVGDLSKVQDFPDVVHGWVNRGDLEDPTVAKNVAAAWEAAIQFTKTVNSL